MKVWKNKIVPSADPESKDNTDLPVSHCQDVVLWDAFIAGDEDAFIEIYNRHFKALCDFGVQFARQEMVEDAVQELFIDLRNKRSRLPALKKTMRPFLFQCLKHSLFNRSKKEKTIKGTVFLEHRFEITPSQETVIILDQERKFKLEKLNKALAGLNEKQREALYYYFQSGMSYEEIREVMGYRDVKSARNLIYKVVNTLKKSFLFFL